MLKRSCDVSESRMTKKMADQFLNNASVFQAEIKNVASRRITRTNVLEKIRDYFPDDVA